VDYSEVFVISLYSYVTLLYVTLIILLTLRSLVELQLLSTLPSTVQFPNLEASQQNIFFYGVGFISPMPDPHPVEDQGFTFFGSPPLTCQDNSAMQAPPLCQSMDTLGETFHILYTHTHTHMV